jgi:peptidyl-prolyl cis-trans isomerase B (cyclophilin B)
MVVPSIGKHYFCPLLIKSNMKKLLPILLFATLISGCDQDKDDYVVTIKTRFGEMKAVLYDETPLHKKNFLKLADEKYFDSTLFHRVMQEFMIQGGDPDSKTATPGQQLGQGGPGYTVPAEILPAFYHEKGALSAARLSDAQNPKKESSGSQFYIVQGRVMTTEEAESLKYDQNALMQGLGQMFQSKQYPTLFDSLNQLYASGNRAAYETKLYSLASRVEKISGLKIFRPVDQNKLKLYTTLGGTPHLDGEYTVFGKVIKGLDVLDKIAASPTDEANRPFEDIRMSVTVEKMSKKKIEKEFGWKYPTK